MDVADYAKNQDSGSIRSSCHIMPPKCGEKPCMHGGKCTEGWNRFICDCTETSFTGPTCGRGEFKIYRLFHFNTYFCINEFFFIVFSMRLKFWIEFKIDKSFSLVRNYIV